MKGKIARKAVLIYPCFDSDTFWSLQRTLEKYIPRGEFGLPKRTLPPLGLMGLFNYLKPYYEELVLIDRNIDPRPLKKIIADADHVYMGGMTAQQNGFLEDAKIIEAANKPLVVGGTIVDENLPLRKMKKIILVENEAEMVMPDVLDDLAHQRFGAYYKGMHTLPEKFFKPDFSSINMKNYLSMAIQISRGCPHDCEFCDITARFGRNPRVTSWKNTEASIRQLYDLGYRDAIFIVDDNFIGNPVQTIETLKKIYKLEEELGYHFSKYTELTLKLSEDSKLMKELRYWLRKTNFNSQFIGVETNNIASLKETGKDHNLTGERPIQEKLSFISKETGGATTIAMIHGFDNDTRLSADSLINFINSTHAPTVMVGLLTATYYTKLWKRLKKEGRLMEESSGNNTDGTINFIPYNFSAKDAEQDYVKILKAIYNEKAFFTRVMRELVIIKPVTQLNRTSLKEGLNFGIYFVPRILTKKNATTFLKYLPKAHKIAAKRFGFNTPNYRRIIGLYFAHCAKFTHFKGLTENLEEQLKHRKYEPWQLYSWKGLQESKIASIDVIKKPEDQSSLYEKIRMKLDNGYEFVGTRLEALAHFTGPYLKRGLLKLKNIRNPSIKQFLDVELKAYYKAHLSKPEILGRLKFAKVKNILKERLKNKISYRIDMHTLFKNAIRTMALKDVHQV